MPKLSFKKISTKLKQVYPVPQVLNKLLLVINDPWADIHEIANIVKQDQSFTLKLLKLANSAYYAPAKISSVEDAVMLLGFDVVKQLTIQAAVMQQLGINYNKQNKWITSIWKHSVAVAVAAKVIATHLRLEDTNFYFTAGILHDVGMMIEYQFFQKEFLEIVEQAKTSTYRIVELEKKYFGYDHSTISCMLIEQWQLPSELKGPIANHHQPLLANENEKLFAAILRLADVIAMQDGLGGPYEHPDYIAPETMDLLRITKDRLELLMTTYQNDIKDVFPYLEN